MNRSTRRASENTCSARWRSLKRSARTGKRDVKRASSSSTDTPSTAAISSRVYPSSRVSVSLVSATSSVSWSSADRPRAAPARSRSRTAKYVSWKPRRLTPSGAASAGSRVPGGLSAALRYAAARLHSTTRRL